MVAFSNNPTFRVFTEVTSSHSFDEYNRYRFSIEVADAENELSSSKLPYPPSKPDSDWLSSVQLSYDEDFKQAVVKVREELDQKLQAEKEAEVQAFKEQCEQEIEQKYSEQIQKLIQDNGNLDCPKITSSSFVC